MSVSKTNKEAKTKVWIHTLKNEEAGTQSMLLSTRYKAVVYTATHNSVLSCNYVRLFFFSFSLFCK